MESGHQSVIWHLVNLKSHSDRGRSGWITLWWKIRVWFSLNHTLTEWDLARSHSDERLECDSAYFEQWKFRLRVVLLYKLYYKDKELKTLGKACGRVWLKSSWVDVRRSRLTSGQAQQRPGICGRGQPWRARRKGRKLLEERSRIEVVRSRGRERELRGKEEKIRECTESGNLLRQTCTFCTQEDPNIKIISIPSIPFISLQQI